MGCSLALTIISTVAKSASTICVLDDDPSVLKATGDFSLRRIGSQKHSSTRMPSFVMRRLIVPG